jgi:hypothetical protein
VGEIDGTGQANHKSYLCALALFGGGCYLLRVTWETVSSGRGGFSWRVVAAAGLMIVLGRFGYWRT